MNSGILVSKHGHTLLNNGDVLRNTSWGTSINMRISEFLYTAEIDSFLAGTDLWGPRKNMVCCCLK